jgi:putative transposase
MQYRRSKTKGATYFFTLVTHNRRQILCQPENVDLLRGAFRYVMQKHPFKIDAIVILPDHLHCIYLSSISSRNPKVNDSKPFLN